MSASDAKKRKIGGPPEAAGGDVDDAPLADAPMAAETLAAGLGGMLAARLGEMKKTLSDAMAEMREEVASIKRQHQHEMKLVNRKCEFLEAKCKSLERSVMVLMKSQDWQYPVPDIPFTQLVQRGYDEDRIDQLDVIAGDLKDATCNIRHGDRLASVALGRDDEIIGTIAHDDVLLHHWTEFADAVQLYGGFDDSFELSIRNVQLPDSVLDKLSLALKAKEIRTMMFENISSGRGGLNFAVDVVQHNPSLKYLGWTNNHFDDESDITQFNVLLRQVTSHPSIEHICLDNCFEDSARGYEVFCSLLSLYNEAGNLKCINFNANNIRTEGGSHLAGFIATNPSLEELNLEDNHLDDNDAALVAAALKENTNLRFLILDGNDLTGIGFEHLRNATFDSTTLNSIADSNHTCCVSIDDEPVLNEYADPKTNRAHKIHFLLSNRSLDHTIAQHFDEELGEDASLALVPWVLASVNNYSSDFNRFQHGVLAIDIMYEIIRGWKMPELYEQHGTAKGPTAEAQLAKN